MVSKTGIYKITSKVHPERMYIGSAVDINHRKAQHKYDLLKQKHGNPRLQNHVNKYGFDDLEFSVVELCERDVLYEREDYFKETLDPFFNIADVNKSPMFGRRHTKETIEKLRITSTGKPSAFKGMTHTQEAKDKNRDAHIGKKATKETKSKISKALKGKKKAPFSDDHKKHLSLVNIGKKLSPETKQKISIAFKGKKRKPFSQEHCDNISKGHKGKTMSDEFKRKVSISKKKMWEEKRNDKEWNEKRSNKISIGIKNHYKNRIVKPKTDER